MSKDAKFIIEGQLLKVEASERCLMCMSAKQACASKVKLESILLTPKWELEYAIDAINSDLGDREFMIRLLTFALNFASGDWRRAAIYKRLGELGVGHA